MKKTLKTIGLALGALALLALSLLALASVKASARLTRTFHTHRIALALPDAADQAAVARGKHLVEARYGCNACHGSNLAGGVMMDEPAIGSLLGPNLTRGKGGRTADYSMADWDRIVRHGVKPDGSAAVMPSEDFLDMSDAELSDIVAYARALPVVDTTVAAPSFGPVGKILLALGKFPLSAESLASRDRPHASHPPESADTPEFGAHLAAPCMPCHRSNLAGGPMQFGPPNWPAAANLTPHAMGLRDIGYDDFERILTQGIGKDGHTLREPMSAVVAGARAMSPTERKALWTYLRSLAPQATNP